MEHMDKKLDRRNFLKAGLTATAAVSALGLPAANAAVAPVKAISVPEAGIPVRPFGKTGLRFPVLGHGGSALMEKEYAYYGLSDPPSREARVAMIRDAYDKGIRFFDTARIYHESEALFGEALKGVRQDVYLASKVLVGSREEVRPSVEQSLEALQMDYIDCMQIHGPSIERLKYEGAMELYEELVKLKGEGLIHYIGMTGHNAFDEMYKMIDTGHFDQVLIEYGYFRKGYNTRHSERQVEWRENCLARAHELDMAIVAMKVLGAWVFNHNAKNLVDGYPAEQVARLPQAAIRWVMNDPRVSLLNIGMSYPGDVDRNLAVLRDSLKLTMEDRQLLADFSAKAYEHPSVQEMPVV